MPLAPSAPERPKAAYRHPLPPSTSLQKKLLGTPSGVFSPCSPSIRLLCPVCPVTLFWPPGHLLAKPPCNFVRNTCNINWNFALGAKCGVPMDYIVFA